MIFLEYPLYSLNNLVHFNLRHFKGFLGIFTEFRGAYGILRNLRDSTEFNVF